MTTLTRICLLPVLFVSALLVALPSELLAGDEAEMITRYPEAALLMIPKEERAALTSVLAKFPSYEPRYPPPAGVKSFELSQDYPTEYPPSEKFPWMDIDFRNHPYAYAKSVLDYCLEGNIEVNFKVQENPTRKWYHAPRMHTDGEEFGGGREFHRGMTRERRSREFELHTLQDVRAQNWAVGFYNIRGGYTLGRVWNTASGVPEPRNAVFPDNTVTFKLLFTDAPVDKVPFLRDSVEWLANVYPDTRYNQPRIDKTMRLLQVDIAVKDPRASAESGWVFGTFIYDAGSPGNSAWKRLVPVGIAWGDDSEEMRRFNESGVFLNHYLDDTRVNHALVEVEGYNYDDKAYVRHFGLGGRLNGPVDNPISSCISCHGRAGTHTNALPLSSNSGRPLPFANFQLRKPEDFTEGDFRIWFKQVRSGVYLFEYEDDTYYTTDYSLQISAGIRNFYSELRLDTSLGNKLAEHGLMVVSPEELAGLEKLPIVTREIDSD